MTIAQVDQTADTDTIVVAADDRDRVDAERHPLLGSGPVMTLIRSGAVVALVALVVLVLLPAALAAQAAAIW